MRQYKVSYRPTEDGVLASVYAVPGCHCEAATKEAAAAKIKRALHIDFEIGDEVDLIEVPEPCHRH